MKKIILSVMLVAASLAMAVPATREVITFKQPTGGTVTMKLLGDEFINWGETEDGYALVANSRADFVYAKIDTDGNMVASEYKAQNPELRSAEEVAFLAGISKHLHYSDSQVAEKRAASFYRTSTRRGGFPSTGQNLKMLMILANFSDTTPMATATQERFSNFMNQPGFNGTGSFNDYYKDQSHDTLSVVTTVTQWVNLPQTHNYYGPQTMWNKFARDCMAAADAAGVDYSQYDNNNDGKVDGIAIIHQGKGQEYSGNTYDIWSHSSTVSGVTYDGVQMAGYTTQPEKNSSGGLAGIATMCHEFGHNMGAPDFYDTDYATGGQGPGTGDWDVMCGGSSDTQPPRHNPYTKAYYYNWITPVLLTNGQHVDVANSTRVAYRYNTKTNNEFFLLENRQKNLTGYSDRSLPGKGMLIYHADGNYIVSHNAPNTINAISTHQGLYVKTAGNTQTPSTGSAPWPGTQNKTTFTDTTTPNAKSWAGVNTEKPLTNITENTTTKVVSFDFGSAAPVVVPPTNLTATFSDYVIHAGWTAPASATGLAGYNVYVDGNKANTTVLPITQLSFDIPQFEVGTHAVTATAVYTNPAAESAPSNSVNITVTDTQANYWLEQNSSFTATSRGIRDIFPVDSNVVWITNYDGTSADTKVQEYAITTNGGTTWVPGKITFTGSTTYGIGNLSPLNATTAFASIYPNTTAVAGGGIYKTEDGGATWTRKTATTQFTVSTSFANIVHMFNSNEGFAQGDPATQTGTTGAFFEIYTTTDGGNTWTRVPKANIAAGAAPAASEYGTVNVFDAKGNTAWFGTTKGAVYKSTDKGLNWTRYTTGATQAVVRILFTDENNGIVVTSNGATPAVYSYKKSVDGGAIWTAFTPSGISTSIFDIVAIPGVPNYPGTLMAVSANEAEKSTSVSFDYGMKWYPVTKMAKQYTGATFFNARHGWAGSFNGGEDGTNAAVGGMFKWNNATGLFGSFTDIEEESSKPVVAKLHQNYPNPFNPNTTISFDLVNSAKVQLTVFNAKGEMVKTLVNNTLSNGVHAYKFDGSSLNSGVYFYQLNVDGNVLTSKMVLVK